MGCSSDDFSHHLVSPLLITNLIKITSTSEVAFEGKSAVSCGIASALSRAMISRAAGEKGGTHLVENQPDSGIVIIEMGIFMKEVVCRGCSLVDFLIVITIIPGFEVKSGLIINPVNSLEAAHAHLVGAVWEFDELEVLTIAKTDWTFLAECDLTKVRLQPNCWSQCRQRPPQQFMRSQGRSAPHIM